MGETVNPFSSLPDEICIHVLDFLDGRTLMAVQQTCRRFRGIITQDYSYRLFKPLIDRLPYQRRLEAYEELLSKVSTREKAGVKEELQWLNNLELIGWEEFYKNKGMREKRRNQMKELLKKGKWTRSYSEAYFVICNVHSFIQNLSYSKVKIDERGKALLRELVIRCAELEEEENSILSIDALVIFMSYKPTIGELRMFFKSLVVEVAAMSLRWRKKTIDRVQRQLTYCESQFEEEMKEILKETLLKI